MPKRLCDIIQAGDLEKILKNKTKYDARGFLTDCAISGIEIMKETRTCNIGLVSDKLIDYIFLKELAVYIGHRTGLSAVNIDIRFEECGFIDYFDEIIKETIDIHNNLAYVLEGCKPSGGERSLDIILQNNGMEILYIKKADKCIEDIIRRKFGVSCGVRFISGKASPAADLTKAAVKKAKLKKSAPAKPKSRSSVLLGKAIRTEKKMIAEIGDDDDTVVVEGWIFKYQRRRLNSGRTLYFFGVTDKETSVYVKAICDEDCVKTMDGLEGDGSYVKIRGAMRYDTYSKERVLFAKDIMTLEKPERIDRSEQKRVELHAHTQMSAMDAVSDTAGLVEQASKWGHKAIAITDHGVLHAYPEAYEASKRFGVKVIYGLEGYLVSDNPQIVENSDDRTIKGQYTVIDIETTGLSLSSDMIIELGAVKIKDGQITDTYTTFVDPCMPVSIKITELTGISGQMLANAPKIEEVLHELVGFIEDDCLVAHNAIFDMSIIRREAEKAGLIIDNPILDTLALSKVLLPDLKRNRLATVARKLGVKVDKSHRALDDALTTANVLRKFFDILEYEKDVRHLKELNLLLDTADSYRNSEVYHVILLVKNKTGLKNLYKIVSRSQLEYFHKRPRIPKKLLSAYRDGIIVGSACEKGELFQALLTNKSDKELSDIAEFYDYLEVQPVANNVFLIRQGAVKDEGELKDINRRIIDIGKKSGRKVIASCDLHFIDREDAVFREILLTGEGYEDAGYRTPLYFRTTEEMLGEFAYLGSETAKEVVIDNTNTINDMIDDIVPIPDGIYPPKIDNSDGYIKEITYANAEKMYGAGMHPMITERIAKELGAIIKHGFSVMYMIAHKLVKKSLEDGFLVGSRGSVGSSFVAFLMGITEVNSLPPHYICTSCFHTEFSEDPGCECGFDLPDKICPACGIQLKKDGYDIPFETFLGFDGDKEPDIDLNFSGFYQNKAHKFIEELFGRDHVYRAGTVSKLAFQTAYGYVMKYIETKELNVPKCEVERLTEGCVGVRKTTGQHPGGIMIIPRDKEIYDFTAIGYPADDIGSGTVTTHFDYHFLKGCIYKLDILGHDDPTMINMLQRYSGKDPSDIVFGDREIMEIFRSTSPLGVTPEEIGADIGTLGIPEFGTPFVRGMLGETRPGTYAELVRISGLSHGTDVWLGNTQKLITEKTATLKEAICCRDDIMIYLLHKNIDPAAAFSIMEHVRKGKGLTDDMAAQMKSHGVPEWYIWSCRQIKYMFPKAHAAAYVSMAFRIAWYKVHEPLSYYAAYYSTRCDEFDSGMMIHGKQKALEYLEKYRKMDKVTQREKNIMVILEVVIEMYARGFEFLPVSLYLSDAYDFIMEDGKIRPPLRSIPGLGENVAGNIAKEREKDAFMSVEDLVSRAKVSRAMIDSMIDEGCLKDLPLTNQLSLF